MRMKVTDYGKELIIDLHKCNPDRFTREHIENYFKKLCVLIDMQRCKLTWWDDLHTPEDEKQTSPHTKGTTAVQFILTSNITIHTLDNLQRVYLNIFSCKYFNDKIALEFSAKWFEGMVRHKQVVRRI